MSESYRIYSAVCRILGFGFAIVAVALLVVPGFLTATMEFFAGLAGLQGKIALGAGDLDHVLSVSLMACIVVLAFGSARRPEQLVPYVALLAAKVVSTVGFVYLAVIAESAWALAAVTDGSVIAALVLTRSFATPSTGKWPR